MDTLVRATTLDAQSLSQAIKPQLREMIASWITHHPDRIVMHIPARDIKLFASLEREAVLATFAHLDGYVGAALHEGPVRIPWSYELHALPLSEVIEVLLRIKKLREHPLRCMADEVATIALSRSHAIAVDEIFSFSLPLSILERVDKMSGAHRAQFDATLNRRLHAVGLSAHAGTVTGGLQIRRNLNR